MNASERIGLLHQVAGTIRSGGDIDVNQQGDLEIRSSSVAGRLFGKISTLTGIESKKKFKISEGALTQINTLMSKVAQELGSENKQVRQDFEEVKTNLAHIYFSHSQSHPWTELLMDTSSSSSITLTSFAQSHQALIKEFTDVNLSSRLDKVDPHIHNQCAGLFVKLVQRAIKEGEEGHHHVEHTLLLLAEQLMANYQRSIVDPSISPQDLNKNLKTLYNSLAEQGDYALTWGDDFYLMFGALSISADLANRQALKHLEAARQMAMEDPLILMSGVLDELTTEPQSIKEALAFLEAFPQQTTNSDRVRIELISALRLKALSAIKFDPKNLNATWSKRTCIRHLKNRVQYFQDQANYNHKRVASHLQDLQSKVTDLENQITFLIAVASKAPPSKNLSALRENLKKLNIERKETKERLESFFMQLKVKDIESTMLDHPVQESLPTLDAEKLKDQSLLGYSDGELDQQIDDLKKAYHFLKQREADLEEILPDPFADLFD